MRLRDAVWMVLLALLLGLAVKAARAEEVIETWRNPFGHMRSVSVNSTDSSVWVASGGSVLHLAADGAILSQTSGFSQAGTLAVNQTDGSCWVDDDSDLVHLAADGTELLRVDSLEGRAARPSVNAADGSCWVACSNAVVHVAVDGTELWRGELQLDHVSVNPSDGSCWAAGVWTEGGHFKSAVVHLAADGTELWRASGPTGPLSTNAADGSCWVLDTGNWEVIHLAADGTELWRGTMSEGPLSVSVNPTDGTCWVTSGTQVTHLGADGSELWRGAGFEGPFAASASSADGSCWLVHRGEDDNGLELVHLSDTGAELWRRDADFGVPLAVASNPMDGSCWLSWTESLPITSSPSGVSRLADDGTEVLRVGGFEGATHVSIDPVDGSWWVADVVHVWDAADVVHLSADGTEMVRVGGFMGPLKLSVNETDGSVWVADYYGHQVAHLAENGAVISRSADIGGPCGISVNPVDGSCWIADGDPSSEGSGVVHLAQEGTELWRGGSMYGSSASVNPVDGSCWAAGGLGGTPALAHLAEDGTELWRGEVHGFGLSVNPVDGSCWVLAGGVGEQLIHVAADGTELWRGVPLVQGVGISANPMDGSCWVTDLYNGQVIRLQVVGYQGPHFPDIMPYHWAYGQIEACADSAIVGGYPDGLYHPANPVTRAQMAVYISRALVQPSGDAMIPDPELPPSFSDVATDHWAHRWVEYAVSHDVVQGYPGGTYHPDEVVNRGQMAVYVARAVAGGDAAVPADTDGATFIDVTDANDWAWCYGYVEYCAGEGIVQGYPDGSYHPEREVTRDQMAVYVARAFELPM